LILVDLLEHGSILSKLLDVPFVFGGGSDKLDLFDDFKSGKVPILVCSPVAEEDWDVKGIRVIVLASGGKSKIKLLQRIGRGMRKMGGKFDVDIVDFYDVEIGLLERHTKKRIETYAENGFRIDKL
jgi:superfamily II DNA or RNA helicase